MQFALARVHDLASKVFNCDDLMSGVEKVSNLVFNINVYIAHVKTNNFVVAQRFDIRGNDDTSWMKGSHWMLCDDLGGARQVARKILIARRVLDRTV